jgi:cytochrome c-type biogenesis protein
MSFDLIAIFSAGLLTFLAPCVLPLIPIYLSALMGGDMRQLDNTGKGQLVLRAGFFSLGFIAVYTVMGLGASAIGGFLIAHRSVMQAVGAVIILVFGLKFLGIIRIPFLDRVVRADDTRFQTRYAWVNASVMGAIFAAGWSPCVGPVIGAVLTYTASATANPLVGAGYLATYGLGFAVPLLLTAAFAEAGASALRRVGPYLPRIEKAMGVVLVVVASALMLDAAGDLQSQKEPEATRATAPSSQTDARPLPKMVELYSEECGICQRMKPVVERLIEQCDKKGLDIELLDVSKPENRYLVSEFRVVGVPTFLFLDENELEVARLVGEQTESALKQALSALRGEQCPGLGPVPAEGG